MSANEQEVATLKERQTQWLAKNGLTEDTWSALTNSIYPGAEAGSIMMAVHYCKARGLDILKKPVHIVPMNVKDAKTGDYGWRDVVMPGIAEYRITAMRTGLYAGMDDPEYGDLIEHKGITAPEYCRIRVYRMFDGVRVPFPHVEYFVEAVNTKKDGSINAMWTKRPRGQLTKTAEAGALRKAFPEEFGGMITADEAQDSSIIQGEVVEPASTSQSINDELEKEDNQ